jgi:hypothetical protein
MSGINGTGQFADPDPGSDAFLTLDRGSGIWIIFLELRNHFFGLKYLNSLMRDEKIWIRDGKKSDTGINIPDTQHW